MLLGRTVQTWFGFVWGRLRSTFFYPITCIFFAIFYTYTYQRVRFFVFFIHIRKYTSLVPRGFERFNKNNLENSFEI